MHCAFGPYFANCVMIASRQRRHDFGNWVKYDLLVVLLVVIGKLIKPQRLVFPLCSLVFVLSLPVIVLHNKVSKFLISHILSFSITCLV